MRVGFIYNPESGSGKIERNSKYIVDAFTAKGHVIDILKTKKTLDAKRYAIESDHDMLLVAGGDGTLNEVVNGLMTKEKRPKIAYIPTGTVNDVAHMLGISMNVKKAVKLILETGEVKKMDVSKINDTYFTYAAATGRFTKASYDVKRKDKKRFGILAYIVRGITDLLFDYKMPMKITYDGGVLEKTFTLLLFLNGPRVGGRNLYLMKKSKLNDGKIEARIFEHRRFWMLIKILTFFAIGGLVMRGGHRLTSSFYEIEVEHDQADIDWNTDGEKTEKNSVRIDVIQEAIEIYVSKRAAKYIF
ncbi:diacylglycerol/lipid kinase family protein [Paracholeplasma manati]|uniref:Diacylglycerol kinase family lipid kinase n=1 Tax=Paracholeplasma manati TaxID=591373 RepID=A0ABT2Y3I7_9MOLU|nr:diacylglycerol kinase family protein [Paracholeplasma manati]MCV2231299.1 diacylglycerol kinase family lipid kinase [Paracholeplasma manati]MDG0888382.1 diacylglycerol kinase family lipid kinase [Paracholeplasma manati]